MAIGAFGVLDPEERKGLAEAAEEGDGEALQELRANHVEAIEAMLGALEDPESRKLIELGMTLALTGNGRAAALRDTPTGDSMNGGGEEGQSHGGFEGFGRVETVYINFKMLESADLDEKLDMVEEQLEMQLQEYGTILIPSNWSEVETEN